MMACRPGLSVARTAGQVRPHRPVMSQTSTWHVDGIVSNAGSSHDDFWQCSQEVVDEVLSRVM
jgi:hypothetical protein